VTELTNKIVANVQTNTQKVGHRRQQFFVPVVPQLVQALLTRPPP